METKDRTQWFLEEVGKFFHPNNFGPCSMYSGPREDTEFKTDVYVADGFGLEVTWRKNIENGDEKWTVQPSPECPNGFAFPMDCPITAPSLEAGLKAAHEQVWAHLHTAVRACTAIERRIHGARTPADDNIFMSYYERARLEEKRDA